MKRPLSSDHTPALSRRGLRRWHKIMVVLASLAVFCTTYALILPALTLERGCSLPEHTHTDACYTRLSSAEPAALTCTLHTLNVHSHTAPCYDETGALSCGYADFLLHTHDALCYQDGVLLCSLPELSSHFHTDACYTTDSAAETEPLRGSCICPLPEGEGHTHGDGCYDETGALSCTLSELDAHSHTDACYEWHIPSDDAAAPVLTCQTPERIAHTHTESCYSADGALVCGMLELSAHQHTAACFAAAVDAESEPSLTCTNTDPAHTHTALCYGAWELNCVMQEHTHSDTCQSAVQDLCGLDEHTHSETCYNEDGTLSCEKEVHLHSESCQPLDPSDQAAIDAVDAQIDALPNLDEIQALIDQCLGAGSAEANAAVAAFSLFAQSDSDVSPTSALSSDPDLTDALSEQLRAIFQQFSQTLAAYDALSSAQQNAVRGQQKLLSLRELFSSTSIPGLEELSSDRAFVEEIKITKCATGTAPFDADDAAGNDSSADNLIIRSFDTLSYSFTVSCNAYQNTNVFNYARVKLEFTLPVTVDEAEFDQSAMGWMQDPVLTTDANGHQILTCYKELLPSSDHSSVVPGEFGENLTINVKMMKNGDTIAPSIRAAMEYNTWDGICAEHNTEETKTLTASPVTVSAAPKYNVQLQKAFASELSRTFDFSASSSSIRNQAYALNLDAGSRPGRIYTYGLTLQLYNDNASKGLRGIELPQGDITFDVQLTSKFVPVYSKNTGGTTQTVSGTSIDVTDEYTPLVWSYDVQSNSYCRDRDTSMTTYVYAFGAAPYNKGTSTTRDTSCYDGGTWSATQEGNVIHFTVSGYQFDGVFPCVNGGQSVSTATYYNKATGIRNIGCFSAAELYIVQPFTTETGIQVLNDFSAGGTHAQSVGTGVCSDGSFNMTLNIVNLQATSVSNQSLTVVTDNSNQGCKTDDTHSINVALHRPGNYEQRNLYSKMNNPSMSDVFGLGENVPGTCATNGNDWATIGTTIGLTFGGYAQTNGDEANKMCAAKWLLKFDAEAFELLEGSTNASGHAKNNYAYTYLYAVKPDGTNWTSDSELKNTKMLDLCYYSSFSAANEHGEIVGVLVEAKPQTTVAALPYTIVETYFTQNARVRSDMALANRHFIITEECMVWTMTDYETADETVPSLSGHTPSDPVTLPKSTYYLNQPSAYKNGDGTYNAHNDSYHKGDTILILGYQASILKKLEQKVNGETKTTYTLDADQRIVDFVLEPRVTYPDGKQPTNPNVTTVTIVDTLPKYLTYRPGSCYFGGTYTQNDENGGTGGTITGGEQKEPEVKTNADGTQTLTWVIENVTVGSTMPLIHYAANVGTPGNPDQDVPIGTTSLTNRVQISAVGDERIHSLSYNNVSEVGLILTRGEASSYGKYSRTALVEPDGELQYVIYYNSNSESPIPNLVLLDTMPVNGHHGNSFTGSYSISSLRIDPTKCTVTDFTLYYTMDVSYAGKTIDQISSTELLTWPSISVPENGVITELNDKSPVLWALVGTLEAKKSIFIDLSLQLLPGDEPSENNVFRNTFSHGKISTTTEEHTVTRTLSGLAWLDADHDGLQDTGETLLSGVRVSLLKLKDGGNANLESDYEPFSYVGTTIPVIIQTGQQVNVKESADKIKPYSDGQYLFTGLPAGTYAVRFESSDTKSISNMLASPVNRGTQDDDIRDSDAEPTYSSDRQNSTLLHTCITGISLPRAEEMSVVKYESNHHDSGFYPPGYQLPNTGGSGTAVYFAGGFLLLAAALLLLHRKRQRDVLPPASNL